MRNSLKYDYNDKAFEIGFVQIKKGVTQLKEPKGFTGVTLKDIAREAKVSVTAVSRALLDKPDIGDETKAKIKKVAVQLGYRPNALARGLRKKQTQSIGLIVSDISNPFFAILTRGVQDIATKAGFHVVVCNTDENLQEEMAAIDFLGEIQVAGILVIPTQFNKDHLVYLNKRGVPVVLLSRHFINDNVLYSVYSDDINGAYLATKHLLEKGLKKIHFINGPSHVSNSLERLYGYQKAHEEAGIKFDPKLVDWNNLDASGGYETTKRIIAAPDDSPVGIFCFSDYIALGALKALHETRLRIPEDIQLVGYDNLDFYSTLNPSLTTINNPIYEMGQKGAETVIALIRGDTPQESNNILPTVLVERNSTSRD
jgi:LacI family transcriptional regulator